MDRVGRKHPSQPLRHLSINGAAALPVHSVSNNQVCRRRCTLRIAILVFVAAPHGLGTFRLSNVSRSGPTRTIENDYSVQHAN